MRTITINKAMNGFIVNVGCQTLVFESADTLLEELGDYLEDPKATERAYLERYGDMPQTAGVGDPPRCEEQWTGQQDLAAISGNVANILRPRTRG